MPFAPRICDFSSVAIANADGSTIIQNPHLGLVLISHSKLLTPGASYLITISQLQASPDVVIDPAGDPSEEHS